MTEKPAWLKVRYKPASVDRLTANLQAKGLHTVCQEAHCPNRGECYESGTATFILLGDVCTRNCRFCQVGGGRPQAPDSEEPAQLAETVRDMQLDHVVLTQVTRDDLADGGAAHMARAVRAIRQTNPAVSIEVLISDLGGDPAALQTVLDAKPDVLNHNVEMVPRLYPTIRPGAKYDRSLEVLARSKDRLPDGLTKSGFMLGLGESDDEVRALLADLRRVRCDIVTISQYLQPSPAHQPVDRYVTPEAFEAWAEAARALGFRYVVSGPLVRSSYRALAAYRAGREA
ncbi:lipoyl synthase [Peptococcus simiae]|uniref:Lipoyl synthase n=1 Tax=Peptococcus simiae TaxID=1643805 RepID=A0ABW9GVF1_9FIRM